MGPKLVAVCGATGKQGSGAVKALLSLGGFSIRALTRNPSSDTAAKLAQPDVELVKADFEDPASLEAAFAGCGAVFAVTDFWVSCGMDADREKKQGFNLVDAAKAAGVKHFVFSTLEDTRPLLAGQRPALHGSYTVPHFDAKAEIEAYARGQFPANHLQLGNNASFILTSIFYENLLPGGGMEPQKQPDGNYALFLPVGQAKTSWCATDDIGGVAAAMIAAGPEEWGSKTAPVAGSHFTLAELAQTFSSKFGQKVVAVTPDADSWIQAVQGFGVPEQVAKDLGNMFWMYEHVGMCDARPVEQTAALWPARLTVDAWMDKHKDALSTIFA